MWREKSSRHSRRMRNSQFYVPDKRPFVSPATEYHKLVSTLSLVHHSGHRLSPVILLQLVLQFLVRLFALYHVISHWIMKNKTRYIYRFIVTKCVINNCQKDHRRILVDISILLLMADERVLGLSKSCCKTTYMRIYNHDWQRWIPGCNLFGCGHNT